MRLVICAEASAACGREKEECAVPRTLLTRRPPLRGAPLGKRAARAAMPANPSRSPSYPLSPPQLLAQVRTCCALYCRKRATRVASRLPYSTATPDASPPAAAAARRVYASSAAALGATSAAAWRRVAAHSVRAVATVAEKRVAGLEVPPGSGRASGVPAPAASARAPRMRAPAGVAGGRGGR